MAFSLAVPVRSPRLKDEMYTFLVDTYKPWSELSEDDEPGDCFQGPFADDQLEIPKKGCIGWNYEPITGPEREYHFALVRWLAIQVGKRRSKFRGEGIALATPVPYVLFDGFEASPVLVQAEWPNAEPHLQAYLYDALGMKLDDSVAHELAWYFLPDGVFERVSATHHGHTPDSVRNALIQEGMPGAQEVLQGIRTEIARLDLLWKDKLAG